MSSNSVEPSEMGYVGKPHHLERNVVIPSRADPSRQEAPTASSTPVAGSVTAHGRADLGLLGAAA